MKKGATLVHWSAPYAQVLGEGSDHKGLLYVVLLCLVFLPDAVSKTWTWTFWSHDNNFTGYYLMNMLIIWYSPHFSYPLLFLI